ncbi:Inorganic pyrophosphatase [Balamuthia mandrillaris]
MKVSAMRAVSSAPSSFTRGPGLFAPWPKRTTGGQLKPFLAARSFWATRTFATSPEKKEEEYAVKEEGTKGTLEYRIFFHRATGGERISPWHDIPLFVSSKSRNQESLQCIIEMPKGTDEKMEIATDEKWNPIKQDTKNGQLRYIKHGKIKYNYGCLPQTWEDPEELHPTIQLPGDNDPLDVVELGSAPANRGQVLQVKVLGALPLVDQGELDWKVLVINQNDPKASLLNDLDDIKKELPGALEEIMEWYRVYKTSEGKQENQYAGQGRPLSSQQAWKVIHEGHQAWLKKRSPSTSS